MLRRVCVVLHGSWLHIAAGSTVCDVGISGAGGLPGMRGCLCRLQSLVLVPGGICRPMKIAFAVFPFSDGMLVLGSGLLALGL